MAKITYNLYSFEAAKAKQGALCVMVASNYTVSPESTIDTDSDSFGGAGICRYKDANRCIITISSVSYSFDELGNPVDTISGDYKLLLGEVLQDLAGAGGAVESPTRTVVTRNADGTYSSETHDEDNTVLIDNLNARDNFAINTLKMLILRADRDPSVFSDNEMAFYCDVAYQWAANMMVAAAKVRATLEDETGTSVDEESLTTNTEKILYDINESLLKTDAKVTIGGAQVDAERITIPELTDSIKNYARGFVFYKYRNKGEAEADGWVYSLEDSKWQKEGYNDVSGSYTDSDALDLPTWKYVNKVSIVELLDVVKELKGIKTQLENIANTLANQ